MMKSISKKSLLGTNLVIVLSLFFCIQNSNAFSIVSQVVRRSNIILSSTTQLHMKQPIKKIDRRQFTFSIPISLASLISFPDLSFANDEVLDDVVQVVPTGDIKKLFNEGRALESQGNIFAAQRLYSKVTKVAPRVRLCDRDLE